MIALPVLFAFLIVAILYIRVGMNSAHGARTISDYLPYGLGSHANVNTSREFSDSTVATTISLATVILAFFELAPYFGIWLFWTVITTSFGLLIVRLFANRIWNKFCSFIDRTLIFSNKLNGSRQYRIVIR